MANERISMRKIRDIIRLRDKGLGYRQIGRALRISHPVVSQYARDFGGDRAQLRADQGNQRQQAHGAACRGSDSRRSLRCVGRLV